MKLTIIGLGRMGSIFAVPAFERKITSSERQQVKNPNLIKLEIWEKACRRTGFGQDRGYIEDTRGSELVSSRRNTRGDSNSCYLSIDYRDLQARHIQNDTYTHTALMSQGFGGHPFGAD